MQAAGAVANLVELRKVSSWQQSSFIEKGGWATLRTAPHWSPFDNGTGTSCLSGNRHKHRFCWHRPQAADLAEVRC